MNKLKRIKSKHWRWLPLAAVALSPVFIAATCGGDDAAANSAKTQNETDAKTYLSTETPKLVAATTSTSDALNFTSLPAALSTTLARLYSLEYSTRPYASAAAAGQSADADWSTAVPTRVSPVIIERALWVRLKTKDQNAASTIYQDLSDSSGVKTLNVNVNALASFATFNLSNVKIVGTFNSARVTTGLESQAELNKLVKVQYSVEGTSDYVDWNAFSTQLSNLNLENKANISVKLTALNEKYQLAADTPTVKADVSALLTTDKDSREKLAEDFLSNFGSSLKVTNRITSPTYEPAAVPALPADLTSYYASLEFSVTNYATTASAISSPDSDWTSAYPTSYSTKPEERSLWLRLKSLDATRARTLTLNVTSTSGIVALTTT